MLKNIRIETEVVLNPALRRSLIAIDTYFDDCPCACTSGVRTAEKQLQLIIDACKKHGINNTVFPEFISIEEQPINKTVKLPDGQEVYWWQRAWSRCLSIGEIRNPPIPAEVLFDYYRDGSTINQKGRVKEISNHMKGLAFDLSHNNLYRIADKIKFCMEKPECFLTDYLVEPVPNDVHVGVQSIT